jgi:DNA-binding NtrC family response regulator
MSERSILVVEDEMVARTSLRRFFEAHRYRIIEAATAAAALECYRSRPPDVTILDYVLPDADGLEVLRSLRSLEADVPVVVLTGHGSIDLAVRAVKEGAEQFLTKPVELAALLTIVERLVDNRRNRQVVVARRSRQQRDAVDPFFGDSDAIRQLAERARRVAPSSLPVLIQGETGVGKGILASWLHQNGPRSSEAFVDLNCAGLSTELLETELFGHLKGAFTGAVASKMGMLEVANHGTTFLDEIGDVPMEVQAKLLKVIEEQRFRRVGDVADREVDTRLIAASHRDLPQRIAEGHFRSDLYYRINGVSLHVPPLRDRGGDVVLLARQMLGRTAYELGREPLSLSPSAERALQSYRWPGNLRELRNVIERAVLLAAHPVLEANDLELAAVPSATPRVPELLSLKDAERRHILDVLAHHQGSWQAAATTLGLSRSAFYQKLRRHGIPPPSESVGDRARAGPSAEKA